MAIDFFAPQCCIDNIQVKRFGICDDEGHIHKTPAYIDYTNEAKWGATVNNNIAEAISFIAVDNCIENITRNDGSMESKCDALLINSKYLVFIELKDQMRNWIPHAIQQLQTTIDLFKQNNDLNKFRYKRAYACNKRHPNFNYGQQELMQSFFQRNNIRLFIECTITLQ